RIALPRRRAAARARLAAPRHRLTPRVSENGKTPEQELAWEAKRRTRAVVAAIAGVTTLAGQLYIQAGVLGDIPRVGLVQAIEPALQGVPAARVDPRS